MTTLTGSFTAPGVSGAVTAAGPITIGLTGEVASGFVTVETSADAGTTWATVWGWDNVLAPRRIAALTDGSNPCDVGYITPGGFPETALGRPTTPPPVAFVMPVGPGFVVVGQLYRIRCVAFGSGSLSWSIAA
jgi:hypothetical protein